MELLCGGRRGRQNGTGCCASYLCHVAAAGGDVCDGASCELRWAHKGPPSPGTPAGDMQTPAKAGRKQTESLSGPPRHSVLKPVFAKKEMKGGFLFSSVLFNSQQGTSPAVDGQRSIDAIVNKEGGGRGRRNAYK